MPLDRVTDPFEKNTDQAQRSAKEQLRFVLANERHLLKVRNGQKKLEDGKEFMALIERGVPLSPNQLSYADGIYEAVWRGAGREAVNLHIDKKRKGLRYPT